MENAALVVGLLCICFLGQEDWVMAHIVPQSQPQICEAQNSKSYQIFYKIAKIKLHLMHLVHEKYTSIEMYIVLKIYIPGTFSRRHLPLCEENVEIHDSAGNVWPIRTNIRQNGDVRCVTIGWTDFTTAKGLDNGDKCIFKLVDDVSIFKVYKYVSGSMIPISIIFIIYGKLLM
ncbi:B3 DNA binding domain [Forsythia ovata]|uniref:B3 DNA binding domain n=1 Tax=Forsythia ovata TaxID=205694 RepID=A0ABD1PVQ1_9LAMI